MIVWGDVRVCLAKRRLCVLVGEGVGEVLKKDGEYLLRIPKDVAEDSNFPFVVGECVDVCFEVKDGKLVEPRLVVKRIDP